MPSSPSSFSQLVGLLIISVLMLALTALFGVWSSHRSADAALMKMGELAILIDESRQTQVAFKTQVQHWKNLLIRGQNQADFDAYTNHLAEQNLIVAESLVRIRDSEALPPTLDEEIDSIRAEHEELWRHYQEAIAAYSSADPFSIFPVDQSVRGIDQQLNRRIDGVADELVARGTHQRKTLQVEGEKLYRNLRFACLVTGFIAMVCAVALAWKHSNPSRPAGG